VLGIAQAAVEALRHPWSSTAILGRAEAFSFPKFRSQLAAKLAD